MRILRLILFLLFSPSGALITLPGPRPRGPGPQETWGVDGRKAKAAVESPPEPTAAIELRDQLFKRQECVSTLSLGSETCGYYFQGEIFSCGTTSHCATSGNHFGCCSGPGCDVQPGHYWTACVGFSSCESRSDTFYTRCCDELAFPYCVTALLGVTKGASMTMLTYYDCGNNRMSGIQTLSPTPSGWSNTCTTTTTSTRSSTSPSIPTSISTTVIPVSTTPPTPVGAIVGGVVGGVAGIALIIAIVFFAFFWGKRKGQGQEPSPPPQPSYVMPPAPHNGPNPRQEIPMTYAPAPTQYAYQSNEPGYQPSEPTPTTPYWPGSAGVLKTLTEERVTGSPESVQVASFPSSHQSSPDPRVSQLSSAPTAVGSPRGYRGPHELGVEREDGELRELRA